MALERYLVEKLPGARLTPGSGAKHQKGDVRWKDWYLECKSYWVPVKDTDLSEPLYRGATLKAEWCETAWNRANSISLIPAIVIDLPRMPWDSLLDKQPRQSCWVLVPEWWWRELPDDAPEPNKSYQIINTYPPTLLKLRRSYHVDLKWFEAGAWVTFQSDICPDWTLIPLYRFQELNS